MIAHKADGDSEYVFDLDTDIRFWEDTVAINQQLDVNSMDAGAYDLYLFFPDGYESIASRPEYAIRLANADLWIEETGYNAIDLTLEIQ